MADEIKETSPPLVTTLAQVEGLTKKKVSDIVLTTEEQEHPRKIADTSMSLEEIRQIPEEHYPIIMYCDGGSLFGWLIRVVDKSAASHIQMLYEPDKIATQWFWYRTISVESLRTYNAKLIWNPCWTPEERKILLAAIKDRLAQGRWKTRYDVWGIVGEALNIEWLQSKTYDFCSEAVGRFLRLVDPVFDTWMKKTCKSPTPRELNLYTKSHNPPYEVYGRHMVDDGE